MKKLLSFAAVALAVSTLFVSCASTGNAKAAAVPSVPHPRSYDADPADGATSLSLVYNQYGDNYQSFTPGLWKFLKADKPQAGDTVNVKMKITSDIDIPALTYYLIDNSPAANYWLNISEDKVVLNMKAGVPVEIDETFHLVASTKGGFQFIWSYDGKDHGQDAYEKVGKGCTLTFEKVGNTTDTAAELVTAAGGDATAAKEYTVKVDDIAKMFAFEQQSSDGVITQYQKWFDLTDSFPDSLPKAGDKVTVTFKGKSDVDIPEEISCHMYESTAAVNWWSEITEDQYLVLGSNLVAGEPFELSATFTITKDCVEGCGVTFYYVAGDGIKNATWMFVRD